MMNKFSLFSLLIICLLPSCNTNQEPSTGCQINATREFSDGLKESLYLEKDNERFIWTRTAKEERWGSFNFYFSNGDTFYDNSNEFSYLDSSQNVISFDDGEDNKYYSFVGSKTIFIYYKDSCNQIKNIIDSKTFYIEVAGNHWFSSPEIYKDLSSN